MIELLALAGGDPMPDGGQVRDDRACYTISMTRDGTSMPMGVTWQTIEHGDLAGQPVIRIVVHQSIRGGAFQMRDAFTLDAATLQPIRLENTRNGQPHVTLDYGPDRVVGQRVEADGVHPIDLALPGPVWDGNLYGVTFAALPLAANASFSVPFFQYDKGLGSFAVQVTGEEVVETPEGPVDSWVLNVSSGEGDPLSYLIAKADHRELGYRSARGGQMLGGDCSALQDASVAS